MSLDSLIVPSEIPWDDLKGKELEELLYWLLISMGAKDLEWRIGGGGGGTADQGRDLECVFYTTSPMEDPVKQTWWVEAKGRTKTVGPSDVKEAATGALANSEIDVLLLATNSHFSNPTRDWVKDFGRKNPRPVIKLWERTELERYCSRHPLAVIRLFSKALSAQGKLEVTRTKLWNYATMTAEETLKSLWHSKRELTITPEALVALAISECASGDVASRSWAMYVDKPTLGAALVSLLRNAMFLVIRGDENGVGEAPFVEAAAYLTFCSIHRMGTAKTTSILRNWSGVDTAELSDKERNAILLPVLDQLQREVRDVCVSDCSRISMDAICLSDNDMARYLQRLQIGDDQEEDEKSKEILLIESLKEPCNAGFSLNAENCCPIKSIRISEADIEQVVLDIGQIIAARTAGQVQSNDT